MSLVSPPLLVPTDIASKHESTLVSMFADIFNDTDANIRILVKNPLEFYKLMCKIDSRTPQPKEHYVYPFRFTTQPRMLLPDIGYATNDVQIAVVLAGARYICSMWKEITTSDLGSVTTQHKLKNIILFRDKLIKNTSVEAYDIPPISISFYTLVVCMLYYARLRDWVHILSDDCDMTQRDIQKQGYVWIVSEIVRNRIKSNKKLDGWVMNTFLPAVYSEYISILISILHNWVSVNPSTSLKSIQCKRIREIYDCITRSDINISEPLTKKFMIIYEVYKTESRGSHGTLQTVIANKQALPGNQLSYKEWISVHSTPA